jgi:hypothetical protein
MQQKSILMSSKPKIFAVQIQATLFNTSSPFYCRVHGIYRLLMTEIVICMCRNVGKNERFLQALKDTKVYILY